ncbi:MAG: AI-2E family transporter [Proteobacteria bacterium]|nr:AI-2E family transporter [Pseudomonadota bacterium]
MKNRGSLITFLILLASSLGAGLYLLSPYLQSLFVGAILALVMQPIYSFLRRKRFGKQTAAALTTIGMMGLILGPCILFAGIGIKQAIGIGQSFAGVEPISMQSSLSNLSELIPMRYLSIEPAELEAHLLDFLKYFAAASSKFLVGLAASVPAGVLQMLLACLACHCLLADGGRFVNWIFGRIPMDPVIRERLSSTFKDTAISVVMASIVAAGSQSVVMVIAFLVLKVPGAFLAGGATFIFAWLPIVGSSPAWLAGAAYLFYQGSMTKAMVMLGFGLVTGGIDNIVRPLVLKGRGEMHPFVSLVAIFGGLQWIGLFGVLLGPILVALIITLLQVWPHVYEPYGSELDPVQDV